MEDNLVLESFDSPKDNQFSLKFPFTSENGTARGVERSQTGVPILKKNSLKADAA